MAFAERLLNLLDQGRFTATYKYAVLLALIDVCQEHATDDRRAPRRLHTRRLAEKVVTLYWPHTRSFVHNAHSGVLQQNNRGQAEIVSRIARFRQRSVGDATAPLTAARLAAAAAWRQLVAFIEWKLIEMPLPRLQQIGAVHQPFIYEIGWTTAITRGETERPGFDRRLKLIGDAGEHLVCLAGLLRPLIQRRHWTLNIARLNRDLLDDADLDESSSASPGPRSTQYGPTYQPCSGVGRRGGWACLGAAELAVAGGLHAEEGLDVGPGRDGAERVGVLEAGAGCLVGAGSDQIGWSR